MRTHSLFRRVVSRVGIDLGGGWWRGSEELIFRALRTCAACPRKTACRSWLDEEHPLGHYPPFCPNGPVIEACRIMDPHATPLAAAESGDPKPSGSSLAEMLDDPLIRQIMEADRVNVERLRVLLQNVLATPANSRAS